MEVITIESEAYRKMMLKLDTLCDHIRLFAQAKDKSDEKKEDVWLDSKAVCRKLNISTRTLYRMKNERLISYSVFRGHCRFRQSDVEAIINGQRVVSNPETFEEMRQSYPALKK
jgi:predicted DNA-binding transcriptional regulator AlpA